MKGRLSRIYDRMKNPQSCNSCKSCYTPHMMATSSASFSTYDSFEYQCDRHKNSGIQKRSPSFQPTSCLKKSTYGAVATNKTKSTRQRNRRISRSNHPHQNVSFAVPLISDIRTRPTMNKHEKQKFHYTREDIKHFRQCQNECQFVNMHEHVIVAVETLTEMVDSSMTQVTNLMLCRDESREPACSTVTRASSSCVQQCDCTGMGLLGNDDLENEIRDGSTYVYNNAISAAGGLSPGCNAGRNYHYI